MIRKSPSLSRVEAGRLCSGCGACALVAPGRIRMVESADGFLRPKAVTALTNGQEERIRRICPGLTVRAPAQPDAGGAWGPATRIARGHATDDELRFDAASGGALSAVLVHLLESDTVDFVLHTAADPDDPAANRTVASRTRADIARAAASRYAPSAPVADIQRHLDGPGRFAFVGKPCDVAALRALAAEDARIDRRIPIMLSFFCAGVPSRRGAEEIQQTLGLADRPLATFRFRGKGWPGRCVVETRDGARGEMDYAESWGAILSRHVQTRCKLCADGVGVHADIAFADAWRTDARGYPRFEEAAGTSLVMARTKRGFEILAAAETAGHLSLNAMDRAEIDAMQPGQERRRRVLAARLAALFVLGRPRPRFRGLGLLRAARRARAVELLRAFLGTGRRAVLGRL